MASPQGAVAVALLLLMGCSQAVELGSRCPAVTSVDDVCQPAANAPSDTGAPLVSVDAAVAAPPSPPTLLDGAATGPSDGGVVTTDANVKGPSHLDGSVHGILPALQNHSFELTRGSPGALAYSPIDPVPLGVNLAEPWSACGFGVSVLQNADSTRNSGANDVLPTNGPGFVEANLGVPALQGLRQTLSSPLKGDVRYSFMIDVRAAVGADVTLEVWGSFVDCVGAVRFTSVGKVPEYWQSVCVAFVPPMDVPALFLQPSLRSSDTNGDLRIFFDNIRSDPNCF
ncbi:MAG: hypothetical protein JWN04_5529 [Myxococcaceae bacterium]|nr:hypothetical protein [Myxococcaceae bacterium]